MKRKQRSFLENFNCLRKFLDRRWILDSWLSQYRQLRLKAMPLSCGSRERDDALVEKTPASAHHPLGVLNKNEPKSCKICQTFFEPDLTLFSTAEA